VALREAGSIWVKIKKRSTWRAKRSYRTYSAHPDAIAALCPLWQALFA
jgi:hypothetical protein